MSLLYVLICLTTGVRTADHLSASSCQMMASELNSHHIAAPNNAYVCVIDRSGR